MAVEFEITLFLFYRLHRKSVFQFLTAGVFFVAGHPGEDGGHSGGHSGGGLSKKQRKARTAFTDHQLQTLEKSFERQKYLSVQDRMELAAKLSLSDTQVKTWYQNRRLVPNSF